MVDEYIRRQGLRAPFEIVPQLHDGYEQDVITELDLRASRISSVIWATGYAFDFSLVKLPVVDADGYPIQRRGVTEYEGLYFLGMPWLHSRRSGILFGVGDDASYLAAHIAARDPNHAETAAWFSILEMPVFASRQTERSDRWHLPMKEENDRQI